MKLFVTEEDRLVEEYHRKLSQANSAQSDADQAGQAVMSHDPNTDPGHVSNEGVRGCLGCLGYAFVWVLGGSVFAIGTERIAELLKSDNPDVGMYGLIGFSLILLATKGKNIAANGINFMTAKDATVRFGETGNIDVKTRYQG